MDPRGEADGSDRRLGAILDALGEAVTIRGRDDRLIYANQAALDRLGFASVEDLRDADPRALMGDYEKGGEHGQEIAMDETLVGFTDGVTDTVGPDSERFGLRRLEELLDEVKDENPTVIRQRLAAMLESFQVGEQADDTAAVFMRFTGTGHREVASGVRQRVVSAHLD